MKKITCGILITDGKQVLVSHATGQKHWDIPKGIAESDNHMNDAIRETKEEIGINVPINELIEVEVMPYNKSKKLHLFIWYTNDLPETKNMVCSSFFHHYLTGEKLPEVDEHIYVDWNELHKYVTKNMLRCLESSKNIIPVQNYH